MRENYFVVGEGILTADGHQGRCERPSTEAELRKFRFSRLGPKGTPVDPALLAKVATAMTDVQAVQPVSADPPVPAGFTYLGQFVDHDLTMDATAKAFGENCRAARRPWTWTRRTGGGRATPTTTASTARTGCGSRSA
jgi:hypothetical protein